ncbi:MAG TPA: type I polyketide synthase, partial [Chitinophagaceae bacterium]|nr:type I polyketide synthase [Chitinophagaceae bacterium]
MEKYTGLEIAVIGMAGKFPLAGNIDQYWENLKQGRDCVRDLTEEEILAEGESASLLKDPSYVRSNAYLESKQYFDAAFFNYRPDEAALMDPQTRIYHECCWEALEDSGYGIMNNKDKIGVFAAGTPNVPWVLHAARANSEGLVDDFTAGHLRDVTFLSSRISYKFNLKGPAIFIQTACSSSLVAIHEACSSLLLGECSMALAGGVNIKHYSKKGYLYKEGMIRSKDGRCKPFDADSNGTIGGEGAGVVVLKRLKDALRDGDHIYALVKGTAINNDGSGKVGYTAPSVKGQAEAIRKAQMMARVESDTIGYVEAHGTATELGDPIEIEALNEVFGPGRPGSCAIGSVKSNMGHLDSAAGVAGFIKTVLAIKNRQIPPSLHFTKPNPRIEFEKGPFYVASALKDWNSNGTPLRAGVSSFGIGGTNAHVVLEEAPAAVPSSDSRTSQLLVISAQTKASLDRNTAQLAEFLKNSKDLALADVAYTLQTGRERFRHRRIAVCGTVEEAIEALSSGNTVEGSAAHAQEDLQQVVFMFPGQGLQYTGMCRALYEKEPMFRKQVDACFEIAARYSGEDLRAVLFEGADEINNTKYAQPLLFIVEYSLAQLLIGWGIRPDQMIGHSIGEYVAACLSGVFSLEDALRLVVRRGELMSQAEKGSMLSIHIGDAALMALLNEHHDVDLAVVNSESSRVVAGTEAAIEAFEKIVMQQGYAAKRLHTSHAFHSRMMDGILAAFEQEVRFTTIHAPQVPYISNITGKFVTAEQITDPSYWSRHLRSTVQFLEGTNTLLEAGAAVFIEAGPGRSLSNYIAE